MEVTSQELVKLNCCVAICPRADVSPAPDLDSRMKKILLFIIILSLCDYKQARCQHTSWVHNSSGVLPTK